MHNRNINVCIQTKRNIPKMCSRLSTRQEEKPELWRFIKTRYAPEQATRIFGKIRGARTWVPNTCPGRKTTFGKLRGRFFQLLSQNYLWCCSQRYTSSWKGFIESDNGIYKESERKHYSAVKVYSSTQFGIIIFQYFDPWCYFSIFIPASRAKFTCSKGLNFTCNSSWFCPDAKVPIRHLIFLPTLHSPRQHFSYENFSICSNDTNCKSRGFVKALKANLFDRY